MEPFVISLLEEGISEWLILNSTRAASSPGDANGDTTLSGGWFDKRPVSI